MNTFTQAPIQTDQPSHLMPVFGRQPISFVRGRGAYLYTADGTEYLDALTGIAVCGLGHSHPEVTQAIAEQAGTLIHTSNLFEVPWQTAAAQKLAQVAGMEEVFFSNSGAESNEGAIKIARKFGHLQGITTPKIIVADHSFHGRTLATLSATGNKKVQEGFGPLVEGFIRVPFGDVEAIEEAAIQHPDIVAILVEPIQGEGGVITADPEFLKGLRELCDQHGAVLIFDEVQTGVGRTGALYAYMNTEVTPDILTTAKALGGGFPIGAMITTDKYANMYAVGDHGTTYGANPLASAVANAVFGFINTPEVLNGVRTRAQIFAEGLKRLNERFGLFEEVRGQGLLIGCVLKAEYAGKAKDIVTLAGEEGLLALVAGPNVVRFTPSLIIPEADIEVGLQRFERALARFVGA